MIVFVVIGTIAALFAGTVFFGAPYVPTHRGVEHDILTMANITKSSCLLDLGCGTGWLLAAAGKRNLSVIGYEINPLLWLIAWLRTRRYPACSVRLANYKLVAWPDNTGAIYIFGSHRDLNFIRRKVNRLKRTLRVVSYGFGYDDLTPVAQRGGLRSYDVGPM
jgi:SAM-dependent methyltransferase